MNIAGTSINKNITRNETRRLLPLLLTDRASAFMSRKVLAGGGGGAWACGQPCKYFPLI